MRLFALVMALVGCGGAARYGDFVADVPMAESAIAADAANKLAIEFPPDEHALHVGDDTSDAFGQDLRAQLRKAGYAISNGAGATARAGTRLQYVLDKIKGTALLRVTLYVRSRVLSRAYAQRADGVHPAGPWSVGAL